MIILDNYIQKAKKNYIDSRVRRNLNSLNNELQDVQRIMVQNIDDVLQRGTVLSGNIFLVYFFLQLDELGICLIINNKN